MKLRSFSLLPGLWLAATLLALLPAPALRAQTSAMTMAVTVTPDTVKPGEQAQYTFTVLNTGTTQLSNVRITNVVPNYLSRYTEPSGATDGSSYFNLAPGQSYTTTFSYLVSTGSVSAGTLPPANGTVIQLTASATADGGIGATASRDVTVENTPGLSVDISDGQADGVVPGQTLTYVLTYANRSGTAITNARVTAVVPAGAAFASASDGGKNASGVVTWNVGALAAGASGTRQLIVTTGGTAGLLVATAQAVDLANAVSAARASDATVVRAAAQLGLTVTATPDPVRPGEQVQYTFTATNLGSAQLNSVRIYDVVPNYLSRYTEPTGATDGSSYFDLAPGQSYTTTFSYLVSTGSASDGILPPADGTVIRLTATALAYSISGSTAAAPCADASVAVVVDSTPSLSLDVSNVDAGSVALGQTLTYVLTYANRGTTAVASTILRATLPAGATLSEVSDGGTVTGDQVQWTLGAVPAGMSGTRYLKATATAAAPGKILLAKAELHDAANAVSAARASDATVVRAAAQLGLTVTATPDPVRPGEQVQYTFTATNLSSAQLNSVRIYDVVPNYLSRYTEPTGATDGSSYFDLAPGQSYTTTFSYLVSTGSASDGTTPPADGTVIRLTATAQASTVAGVSTAAPGADASVAVVVDNTPSLSLDLSDSTAGAAAAGQPFTYVLTYANRGGTAIASARLRAILPPGASFASASDGGTMSGEAVTWNVGALAPGASGTRQLIVKAGSVVASQLFATAEIVDLGNAANAARASDATVVRSAPLLSLTLSATPDPVRPGEQVQYTFTATNLGSAQLNSVRIYDVVPNYLSRYTEPTGATDDSSYFDLAPGQSHTETFSYTVDAGSVSDGTAPPADGTVIRLTATAYAGSVAGSDAGPPLADISHAVTVHSEPVGTFQFSAGAYTVNETAGTATITVTRTGGSAGAASVRVTTSDAGATAGSDYSAVDGYLNWEDGDTAPKTFTILVSDDGEVEDPENLLITLSTPSSGAFLGDPAQATLTISSDDLPLPTVTISSLTPSVVAGSGQNGAFLVSRTGDASTDLFVFYTVKGTALNGYDYVYLKGSVKLKAGKTSKQIKVKPYGYGRYPGSAVVVRMVLNADATYIAGTPGTTKVKVKILGQ